QTGRFMFGVGVNSDAGVSGNIVIDERNFDITRVPGSFQDFVNGTAFRGAGQGFRVEAAPGTQVSRYLFTFTEPYLWGTDISTSVSGFFFNRIYQDWTEERLGGRVGFGYRLAPDTSVGATIRAENVNISQPRVLGVPQLDAVIGNNDIFSGRFNITHDTRDIPFAPTQGHFIELAFEQAFGEFSFPRAEVDARKYYLLRERPDGSGRHTLGLSLKVGASGTDTPIFENYFAGGYSSLRGFNFRGASPMENGVQVGGRFRFLGSAEYMFPLTADDMMKGVVFCDYGTVEQDIAIQADNFRVAPGLGLRINIPALGPAPLAFDFAVPVCHAPGDNIQNFSFFFGFGR
ncbi:MAG TPA: BamA/TamA family outer membrane protein, partial [Pirellulaceae bacterium]|nr:BamA/TamA family outer membrane protein [Pirellulaceae bacterium]